MLQMCPTRHLSVSVAPCAAPPITRTVFFVSKRNDLRSRLIRAVTPRTVCEYRGLAHVRSFLWALVAFCQPPKRIAIFQRYPGSKMAGRVSAERQTLSSFFLRLTRSFSLTPVGSLFLSHTFSLCLSSPLAPSLPRTPYSFLSLFFDSLPYYSLSLFRAFNFSPFFSVFFPLFLLSFFHVLSPRGAEYW